MSDNIPEHSDTPRKNPQSLRLAEMARILSLSGSQPVTVEMLQADVDAGAPVNTDGTLNLIRYAAWLAQEAKNGGD
jgi:hypothetical protein